MNAEHKAKLAASRESNAARFAAQVIKIDSHWTIRRSDELNWEIQKNGKFQGFYSHIVTAFKALVPKMVDEGVKTSLAHVMESQSAVESKIESALWEAKKLLKSQP